MNTALENLRKRICGPQAVTWASFIILAPLALVANVVRLTASLTASQRLAFICLNLLIAFCAVAIARQLLNFRKPTTISPLWLILLIYALIGITRSFTPQLASTLDILSDQTIAIGSLIQNAIAAMVLLSMIAIAMNMLQRQRNTLAELTTQSAQLASLRTHAAEQLATSTEHLQRTINDEIAPTLDEMRSNISQLTNSQATAEQLHHTADAMRFTLRESVQRLSRQLASESVTVNTPNRTTGAPPQLSVRAIIRSLVARDPFAPAINALLILVLFLGISIHTANIVGVLTTFAMSVINFIALLAARHFFRHSKSWRGPTWLVLTVIVGALTSLPNTIIVTSQDVSVTRSTTSVIALQLWCSLVIAGIKAASYQLTISTRALAATNESYRYETHGLEQAITAFRHRVGSLLHGDIQGRLVANALRLDMAADTPQSPQRHELLHQVETDLAVVATAINHITDARTTDGTLATNLNIIATQWNGIVDVTIAPIDSEPVDLTIDVISAITEVVREGVTNAAKHAAATAVSVQIDFIPGRAEILIIDNGRGTPASRSTAVTSLERNLQTKIHTNHLTRTGDTTQLRIALPIADSNN